MHSSHFIFFAAAPLAALALPPRGALAQSAPTTAGEIAPARAYANGSLSLAGGADLSSGHAPGADQFTSVQVSGATRFVHQGLALGLTLGAWYGDWKQSNAATGTNEGARYGLFSAEVSVGYAFVLGDAVALTPTVGYGAGLRFAESRSGSTSYRTDGIEHELFVDLPLTVFLTRHVWVEPHLSAWYVTGTSTEYVATGAGWRLGFTL